MKRFLCSLIIILSVFCSVSLATVGEKEATLNYTGITIDIDGKEVTPKDVNGKIVEPFIIDGTTYLPVRAISESLGKTVTWVQDTHSVYISDSRRC